MEDGNLVIFSYFSFPEGMKYGTDTHHPKLA